MDKSPEFIFFDTNPINLFPLKGMPVSLEKIVEVANKLHIRLGVMDLVFREISQHHIERRDKAGSCIKNLLNYFDIETAKVIKNNLTNLYKDSKIEELLKKNLQKQGIEIFLVPEIKIQTFIDSALNKEPPLSEGGRGFKDSVILFAILKLLKNKKSPAWLVSSDSGFKEEVIRQKSKEFGVNLVLKKTLDSVFESLAELENQRIKSFYKRYDPQLKKILDSKQKYLEKYFNENLTFDPLDFSGDFVESARVRRIVEIKIGSFDKLWEGEEKEGKIKVSFNTQVDLKVELEIFKLPSAEFKFGEINNFKPLLFETETKMVSIPKIIRCHGLSETKKGKLSEFIAKESYLVTDLATALVKRTRKK